MIQQIEDRHEATMRGMRSTLHSLAREAGEDPRSLDTSARAGSTQHHARNDAPEVLERFRDTVEAPEIAELRKKLQGSTAGRKDAEPKTKKGTGRPRPQTVEQFASMSGGNVEDRMLQQLAKRQTDEMAELKAELSKLTRELAAID